MSITVAAPPGVRVQVRGSMRAADVVLPSDQPVALLIPQLLDLLGDGPQSGRFELISDTGVRCDPERTLAEHGLLTGARLRLVSSRETPPAPVVRDVLDIVHERRPRGVWGEGSATRAAWIVALALLGVATWSSLQDLSGSRPALVLFVLSTLSFAAAALAGMRRRRTAGWALTCFASACALIGALGVSTDPSLQPAWLGAAVVACALGVGCCYGEWRMVLPAAAMMALLGAIALGMWTLTRSPSRTGSVTIVAAVLVLGLLPRLALAQSGLLGLDGRLENSSAVRESEVATSLARAHALLASAVATAAVVVAGAGWLTGVQEPLRPWVFALVLLTSVALALRARHFPLVFQRVTLWLAAICGPAGLAVALVRQDPQRGIAVAVIFMLAALSAIMLSRGARKSDHTLAWGRRFAAVVETLAIVACLPVLAGVLGLYDHVISTVR